MDTEKEYLQGLYGSSITKDRACGFCEYHKCALTVKTMKRHQCLKKSCDALIKYPQHDFWRQHEQKKELRKIKKQSVYAFSS